MPRGAVRHSFGWRPRREGQHAGHDVPRARAGRRVRAHAHRRGARLRSAPGRWDAGHRGLARPHARAGRHPPALRPAALRPACGTAHLADLGAGAGVRPRRPRAPRDAAGVVPRRRAARVARGILVASPGPPQAAVGDNAPRRPRGRALGAGEQDASLPRGRRRLGRHRAPLARRLPRGATAAPASAACAQREGLRARHRPVLALARPGRPRCASRPRRRASPARVARPHQGGGRAHRARGGDRRAAIEPERPDERHAPLRHGAVGPRRRQGDQDAPRRHGQRRRSGAVRGRDCATCCSLAATSCQRATCGRRCR